MDDKRIIGKNVMPEKKDFAGLNVKKISSTAPKKEIGELIKKLRRNFRTLQNINAQKQKEKDKIDARFRKREEEYENFEKILVGRIVDLAEGCKDELAVEKSMVKIGASIIKWTESQLTLSFDKKEEQGIIVKLEKKGYGDCVRVKKNIDSTGVKKRWRLLGQEILKQGRRMIFGIPGLNFHNTDRISITLMKDLLPLAVFSVVLKKRPAKLPSP